MHFLSKKFALIAVTLTVIFIVWAQRKDKHSVAKSSISTVKLTKSLALKIVPDRGCEFGDLNSIEAIMKKLKQRKVLFSLESFHKNSKFRSVGPFARTFKAAFSNQLKIQFDIHKKLKDKYFGLFICTGTKQTTSCRNKHIVDMQKIANSFAENPFKQPALKLNASRDYVLFFQPMKVENNQLSLIKFDSDPKLRRKALEEMVPNKSLRSYVAKLMSATTSLPIKILETTSEYVLTVTVPGYNRKICSKIVDEEHNSKVRKLKNFLNMKR